MTHITNFLMGVSCALGLTDRLAEMPAQQAKQIAHELVYTVGQENNINQTVINKVVQELDQSIDECSQAASVPVVYLNDIKKEAFSNLLLGCPNKYRHLPLAYIAQSNNSNIGIHHFSDTPHIFYLQAHHQTDSWSCGYWSLAHSQALQALVQQKLPINSKHLKNQAEEIYKRFAIEPRWLESNEIKSIAQERNIINYHILARRHNGILPDFLDPHFLENPALGEIREYLPERIANESLEQVSQEHAAFAQDNIRHPYFESLYQQYLQDKAEPCNKAINFFCNIGGQHWLVIAIVKREYQQPVLVILDSAQSPIKDSCADYIQTISHYFIRRELHHSSESVDSHLDQFPQSPHTRINPTHQAQIQPALDTPQLELTDSQTAEVANNTSIAHKTTHDAAILTDDAHSIESSPAQSTAILDNSSSMELSSSLSASESLTAAQIFTVSPETHSQHIAQSTIELVSQDNDPDLSASLLEHLDSFIPIQHEAIELLLNKLNNNLKELLNKADKTLHGTKISNLHKTHDKPKLVIELLLFGALTHYALIHNDQAILEKITDKHESYHQAIISLIWFYYAHAISKNQYFEEGTFIIEDIDNRLFNFIQQAPEAYDRPSSHLKAYAKYAKTYNSLHHYGLDLPLLPDHKKTLLFGKINEQFLFIKPENYGLSKADFFAHCLEYIVATPVRKLLIPLLENVDSAIAKFTNRLYATFIGEYISDYAEDPNNEHGIQELSGILNEKQPNTAVFKMLKDYIKTDDDPLYRKERVPMDPLAQFSNILDVLEQDAIITKQQKEEHINKAMAYGISAMYQDCQRFAQNKLTPAQQTTICPFLYSLENQYDNLDVRIGREVILRQSELQTIVSEQDSIVLQNTEAISL